VGAHEVREAADMHRHHLPHLTSQNNWTVVGASARKQLVPPESDLGGRGGGEPVMERGGARIQAGGWAVATGLFETERVKESWGARIGSCLDGQIGIQKDFINNKRYMVKIAVKWNITL
jgi:hypothetical protein